VNSFILQPLELTKLIPKGGVAKQLTPRVSRGIQWVRWLETTRWNRPNQSAMSGVIAPTIGALCLSKLSGDKTIRHYGGTVTRTNEMSSHGFSRTTF